MHLHTVGVIHMLNDENLTKSCFHFTVVCQFLFISKHHGTSYDSIKNTFLYYWFQCLYTSISDYYVTKASHPVFLWLLVLMHFVQTKSCRFIWLAASLLEIGADRMFSHQEHYPQRTFMKTWDFPIAKSML